MDRSVLKDKRILVGITSGIACYKAVDLIKVLINYGAAVQAIVTDKTRQMFPLEKIQDLIGPDRVHTDLFVPDRTTIPHIALADWCDVCLICPATANSIAKTALGLADDLLSTTIVAVEKPLIICPAMNVHMWNNPAVQQNIATLKQRQHIVLEPEYGDLACGYKGKGRLAQNDIILDTIAEVMADRTLLTGKRILVTAGGTHEEIDAARIITNKSSGKMGAALAEQAHLMGAEVLLLRSGHAHEPRFHLQEEIFTTHTDLLGKIQTHVPIVDIVIHAAAVSDFHLSDQKTYKIDSTKELFLKLSPAAKIIDRIKPLNKNLFLVGFKAVCVRSDVNEWKPNLEHILADSPADMVVVNDICEPDRGFDTDTNEVWIVSQNGTMTHVPLSSKQHCARIICENIAAIYT